MARGKKVGRRKLKMVPLSRGNFHDFTEDPHLEGNYLGSRETKVKDKDGERVSLIHTVENEKGTKDFWGSTVLDGITVVPKRTFVTIDFLGWGGKGKGKYKNYDIRVPEGTKMKDPNTPF